MNLCCELLEKLCGRTFSTAESCTGGGIGAAFTAVPGSSAVYKGGVISYTNWVKENVLGVKGSTLSEFGAVSEQTAKEMAIGVRRMMRTTMAVSVTGIAGPGTDERNTPAGTVCIGFADSKGSFAKTFSFVGDRDTVREQAVESAIRLLLDAVNNS